MKKNNKERLFEVMGRIDKSFKSKLNENYSTLEKTERGMTRLFAYPDEKGTETKEGLFNWETQDKGNREIQFVNSKEEAESSLK